MTANHLNYEEIYEKAPIGHLVSGLDGSIIQVNQTLCDWIGYSRKELLEIKNWVNLLTMGSKIYYETHFYPLLLIQCAAFEIHFDMRKKNGNILPVLVNANLLQKNEEKAYSLYIFDITQRREYEKELMYLRRKAEQTTKELTERNEELKRLASTIAHDLKSPIASVYTTAIYLQENIEEISSEQIQQFLELIGKSIKNQIDFIDKILNYYREGKLELTEKPYNLLPLLREIVRNINLENKFEIEVPTEPILVCYPDVFFQHVLGNLVSNAVKYCDKPKVKVKISYEKTNDFHIFYVEDNGKGIKEEDKEKVFQPFVTLKTKDRFNKHGHGLGLAIVKRMIEKVEGKISFESQVGFGTKFKIELPLEEKLSH